MTSEYSRTLHANGSSSRRAEDRRRVDSGAALAQNPSAATLSGTVEDAARSRPTEAEVGPAEPIEWVRIRLGADDMRRLVLYLGAPWYPVVEAKALRTRSAAWSRIHSYAMKNEWWGYESPPYVASGDEFHDIIRWAHRQTVGAIRRDGFPATVSDYKGDYQADMAAVRAAVRADDQAAAQASSRGDMLREWRKRAHNKSGNVDKRTALRAVRPVISEMIGAPRFRGAHTEGLRKRIVALLHKSATQAEVARAIRLMDKEVLRRWENRPRHLHPVLSGVFSQWYDLARLELIMAWRLKGIEWKPPLPWLQGNAETDLESRTGAAQFEKERRRLGLAHLGTTSGGRPRRKADLELISAYVRRRAADRPDERPTAYAIWKALHNIDSISRSTVWRRFRELPT